MAAKAELVRIATAAPSRGGAAGVAVLDRDGTMPGRGAYLCRGDDGRPAADCLARALRRGGIQRTLRRKVSVDAKLVESVSP